MTNLQKQVVVWRFTDGKPGHEKQSAGLIQGLETVCDVETYSISVMKLENKSVTKSDINTLPDPDLIIGAGHSTHLAMLCTRLTKGGRTVVLMKPTMPCSWFDLVLVPYHDRCWSASNVVRTRGVITSTIKGLPDENRGLMLLGGPSKHYKWDSKKILESINTILTTNPDISWEICDSRRTPNEMRTAIGELDNAEYRHWRDMDSEFLAKSMANVARIWVTADSVSMLYEAIATHASVGIIELPKSRAKREPKISCGIESLRLAHDVQLSSETTVLYRTNRTKLAVSESLTYGELVARKFLFIE